MSDETKAKLAARIIPAEEAKHLPRWELGNFVRQRSVSTFVRPQSQQDQQELTQRLMQAQQAREAAEQAEQARRDAARQAAETAEKEQRAREEAARKIQELAYEEGYQEGHRQGLEEARNDLNQVVELARQLSQTQQDLEAELAPRVVDLALLIARQVVGQELVQHPDLILDVARQAMAQLSGQAARRVLKLHPQDYALLHQQVGDELHQAGWQLQADPSLTRGGCRIQSSNTEVDATLETRWQRTLATLGSTLTWQAAQAQLVSTETPTPDALSDTPQAEEAGLARDHAHDGGH